MQNKLNEFNNLLREIRESKGLKQSWIARESGLSKQMISKMENPGGNPTLLTLLKYFDCVDIDLVEVVGRGYAEWKWDENGLDWGLGAWRCSECDCRNDNIPNGPTINPLRWAGSKFCPNCGAEIVGYKR
jgi:DNA-binding XRE family transcriptional regulator